MFRYNKTNPYFVDRNSGEWSIKKHISIIDVDDFLSKIKPNIFDRLPRKKSANFRKHMKIYIEQFYSLSAVKNYLPEKYYGCYWTLLVISFNSLLQGQMHIF